jgi:hypothetical protein
VGQPAAREHAPAQRQIGSQLHRAPAVVEVLAPAIPVHDVDAAVRAARVHEQRGQIDAVARQGLPHEAAIVVVADRADVARTLAELREQAARISAGLTDVVDVAAEVALHRPVDLGAVQVHVGVHAGSADHDRVELLIHPRKLSDSVPHDTHRRLGSIDLGASSSMTAR